MHLPLQIGITGGIGSGKSLVCKIFKCLRIPAYDADNRAKSLMTTDGILITQIKKEFGDLSYDEKGFLNRQYLGDVVFSNQKRLQQLNDLVHPRVAEDYSQWVLTNRQAPYVIKEAALLYESGSFQMLDKIIMVYAPIETRIRRVLLRDTHRSAAQLQEIIEKQWPDEEKMRRADFVLHNDDSRLLIPQVLELHQRLLEGNF